MLRNRKWINNQHEKYPSHDIQQNGSSYQENFYLGDLRIETTREYKYLGFKITPYGGVTPGLHDLKDRMLKPYFKMKNKMGPLFRKHPRDFFKPS